jgi:ribosomal protein S18 acetylase RimI-like enzyme
MDAARFFLPEEPMEEGYAAWLGKELANPRAVVLVAEASGEIIGYAYGRIEARDWNTLRDRCGVAVDLWVEPEARGAGTGARLVHALCAALEARGAPRVVLNVAARNPSASRLFERLGFRPTMLEMAREAGAAAPARSRSPGRASPRARAASARPRGGAPPRGSRRPRRGRA